jgi:hypothetical protein
MSGKYDIQCPGNNKILLDIANASERESIYQLRHSIYAEEPGQHEVNKTGLLGDSLDLANTYIVAEKNNQVIGFVSITSPGSATFSVDNLKSGKMQNVMY